MHSLTKTISAFALFIMTATTHAETVQIAVAANFTAPMKELVAAFEAETGHRVEAAFGSSGKFYAQIKNGAPFAMLLAADAATPAKLDEEGLAAPGTRFTYAIGSLVLWSADPKLVTDGAKVLSRNDFRKLAIANPTLAPYGAAAVEVMQALAVAPMLEPKLVKGDNIAQTYQFVSTGNAELGFVALSQVAKHGEIREGSGWIVPAELYTPIRQDAVTLKAGADNPAAQAFAAYLQSEPAHTIIAAYGYRF